MQIVAVTGKAGAGKDTVAEWARRHCGARVMAFADPIKLAISAMLGVDVSQWNDRAWKETPLPDLGVSPRVLAQTLGTEWGRKHHPDFWVLALQRRLRLLPNWAHLVVIPDARFENEAAWVRSRGGFVVHLDRPGADGKVGVENHASEKGILLRGQDKFISNEGSIDDLHDKCAYVLGPILETGR